MAPSWIRPVAVLAVMLLPAVSAGAAQPNPALTTTNAVTRLADDTRALGSSDGRRATRRVLLADAQRVGALALVNPCRAVVALRGYRKHLRGISTRRVKPVAGRPGPPSPRGRLERDALAVDAGLKQLPGTRRCGGGAASAKATLESTPTHAAQRRRCGWRQAARCPLGGAQRRRRDFIG